MEKQSTAHVFLYNKSPVSFIVEDGDTMISATEMAKPFGKRPKDWLRTYPAKKLITSLSEARRISPSTLVQVVKGGNIQQGTWMHFELALEFARWLDADFYIWCKNKEIRINKTNNTTNLKQTRIMKQQSTTTQVFLYNDSPVAFQIGNGDTMVNATQMSKPFGKRAVEYLRLPSTRELISAMVGKYHLPENQLVTVKRGGPENGGGTWMHETIALDFAQWLSVEFKLWCLDRVKELLKFGITATPEMLAKAISDPMFVLNLLTHINQQADTNNILAQKVGMLSEKIEEQAPKVEFYDNLKEAFRKMDKEKLFSVTKIANKLKMRPADLNKFLEKQGVQVKRGGVWVLTKEYCGLDYTQKKEYDEVVDEYGDLNYKQYTVWTRDGLEFILSLFQEAAV